MTSSERNARAYCLSIGADPDEIIWAIDSHRNGSRVKVHDRRWRFYIGAVIQHRHAAE